MLPMWSMIGAGGERRAAEQQLHDVLEDHQQAEGDEQDVFLRPAIERAQQRRLDHRAHAPRWRRRRSAAAAAGRRAPGCCRRVAERAADHPGRDVGAERVERAVRQVDDAHDAVDEAQARGDEEEHRRVEERVEHLDDEDRRRHCALTRSTRRSFRQSAGQLICCSKRRCCRPIGSTVLPSSEDSSEERVAARGQAGGQRRGKASVASPGWRRRRPRPCRRRRRSDVAGHGPDRRGLAQGLARERRAHEAVVALLLDGDLDVGRDQDAVAGALDAGDDRARRIGEGIERAEPTG